MNACIIDLYIDCEELSILVELILISLSEFSISLFNSEITAFLVILKYPLPYEF